MSVYGLRIVNDSGRLVLSNERIVPRFVGKMTYGGYSTSSAGGYHSYTLTGLEPGANHLVAHTLPNGSSGWYGNSAAGQLAANGSGQLTYTVQAELHSSGGGTAPECYVFALSRPSSVPVGSYGMVLRDDANQLTCTTQSQPLMVAVMPDIYFSGASTGFLVSGMPSKPAVFSPGYRRIVVSTTAGGGGGGLPSYSINNYYGALQRSGSTIYAAQVNYYNQSGIGSPGNYTTIIGSSAVQPLPIIDAALYD